MELITTTKLTPEQRAFAKALEAETKDQVKRIEVVLKTVPKGDRYELLALLWEKADEVIQRFYSKHWAARGEARW